MNMIKVYYHCSLETTNVLKSMIQEKEVSQIERNTIVLYEVEENEKLIDLIEMKLRYDCEFIFIVNAGSQIFDLLEAKPLGFIRQQYLLEEKDVLVQLLHQKDNDPMLQFQNGGNLLEVSASHILYLEAQAHYLMINTSNAVFKVREKISDAIIRLAPYGFRQVHRSYIVNEEHIVALTQNDCILKGNIYIPLSKKFR